MVVLDKFMNPEIQAIGKPSLKTGVMGEEAICNFIESHICTDVCHGNLNVNMLFLGKRLCVHAMSALKVASAPQILLQTLRDP